MQRKLTSREVTAIYQIGKLLEKKALSSLSEHFFNAGSSRTLRLSLQIDFLAFSSVSVLYDLP